jgi:hypothetical protein
MAGAEEIGAATQFASQQQIARSGRADETPNNLPRELTSFVGRQQNWLISGG